MRKHSMVRLSGAVVLAVLFGSFAETSAPAAVSPCADDCYRQKSTAYQRCRTIPPTDRASRTGCFKTADRSLEVCLRACR